MMEVMQQVVEEVTGCVVDSSEQVNIHHNYCSCERCRIVGKDGSVKDEEVRSMTIFLRLFIILNQRLFIILSQSISTYNQRCSCPNFVWEKNSKRDS